MAEHGRSQSIHHGNNILHPPTSGPVYSHLRVVDGQPKQNNITTGTHTVYNGISANMWLTPIGMTLKRQASNGGSSLHVNDECQQTVANRAKSAAAMFGRRHFDLDRQELGKNETLNGKSFKGSPRNANEKDRPHSCATTSVKYPEDFPRPSPRPHTSGGELQGAVRPQTMKDLPSVTVTSLEGREVYKSNSNHPEKKQKKRVTILAGDMISFRSMDAMKQAYKAQVNSADSTPPESGLTRKGANPLSSPRPAVLSRSPSRRPRPPLPVGSSLRPLMYDAGMDTPHGATCPYGCQGCFRACLASEDYFRKQEGTLADSGPPVRERRQVVWTRVRAPIRSARNNGSETNTPLNVMLASPASSGLSALSQTN